MNSGTQRRGYGLLLAASVCVALTSCVPVEHPLSDGLKSEPDKDLIGTWVKKEGEGRRVMLIGRHRKLLDRACKLRPHGLLVYERFLLDWDDSLGRDFDGVFFVSQIKGEKYANILNPVAVEEALGKAEWAYPTTEGCTLVRYRIEKNTLTIFHLDEDQVKAAIKKGTIKGRISNADAILEGGTALADYLAREGGKDLFSDKNSEEWRRARIVPVE
jgi:hypothetical protein